MHLGNLKALSSALNAKDYYTLGHAARVAAYTVMLTRRLGWPEDVLSSIEEAAYLHDIGKISISDRVLLKPSRLNQQEWEQMRQHPVVSADIIRPLFSQELVLGVRHHHERYDGAGYPDGLAGDEIPPLARAMAVVDAYDAMSCRRPYKASLTYSECLTELQRVLRHPVRPGDGRRVPGRARGHRAATCPRDGDRRGGRLPHPRRESRGPRRARRRGLQRLPRDRVHPAGGARRQPAHALPHDARPGRQALHHRGRPRGGADAEVAPRRRDLRRRRDAAPLGRHAGGGQHPVRRRVGCVGHRAGADPQRGGRHRRQHVRGPPRALGGRERGAARRRPPDLRRYAARPRRCA